MVCTCAIAGALEHGRGLAIDERVDRRVRRRALQDREHWGCRSTSPWWRSLVTSALADVAERNGIGERTRHVRLVVRPIPGSPGLREAAATPDTTEVERGGRSFRPQYQKGTGGRSPRRPAGFRVGSEYNPRVQPTPSPSSFPPAHGTRRRQHRAQGADPRGSVTVHPAFPRQDDHRQSTAATR